MAVEQIVKINVNDNIKDTTNNVVSLKTELRKAQQEVALLSDKFGATSKEAIEAAKRASDLKDRIGDAKALTDAFNPDAKFKALSASLSGVAGGFGAIQGSMSLLGMQSESTEKMLLRVQSAMALSQGLQSVGESIDSFKQLGAVISNNSLAQKAYAGATALATGIQKLFSGAVNTTSTSFNVLKGAIISTGIGALVVLLGYAVNALMNMNEATEELTESQKKLNENLKITEQLTNDNIKSLDFYTQMDIESAKKRGASDAELTKIKVDSANKRIKVLYDEINEIKATADSEYGLTSEQNKRIQDLRKQAIDIQRSAKLEIAQFETSLANKQREEESKRQEEAKNRANELRKKQLEYERKRREEDLQALKDFQNKVREAEKEQWEQKIQNEISAIDRLNKIAEEQTKKEEAESEKQKQIELALAQAKQDIRNSEIQAIDGGIGLLKAIAGKNKALQTTALISESAMGIAKIIMNTQTANSAVTAKYALVPGGVALATAEKTLNRINAGIGIATNLVALKNGLSALGGSGGGGSAPSLGSSGGSASAPPQFNIVGQNSNNQLAQTIGQQQSQPIQTYVVAGNITTAQSLDRNKIDTATFN